LFVTSGTSTAGQVVDHQWAVVEVGLPAFVEILVAVDVVALEEQDLADLEPMKRLVVAHLLA
jgi:hypothetical protein